ncbi:spore germination protein [Cohnella luojiensis]|uniref:Spore germination protein n=1 Tax=Cohnella luojiensis TaxID=652876 RepID=A0A4Y8LRK1_9BACL|nr:spore germination protein [Cohnella luojiensis]TFE23462.1 spore germination protein [Cohnella luojiensis]
MDYIKKNKNESQKETIAIHLHENIEKVKQTLGNSTDLIISELRIGENGTKKAAIIYTDGLVDTKTIHNFMEPFMIRAREIEPGKGMDTPQEILRFMEDMTVTVGSIKEITDFSSLFKSVLSGDTVFLLDGLDRGIVASTRGWEDRGVSETSIESVVRGPRESFTETLRTNTSLIRRRIKDPHLWMETIQIGQVTQTDVSIMYIKGIVNDKVLKEVRERLNRINIDGILESGNIEEMIQDETFTPFPTMYNTERPDVASAGLMEGRVAIIVDGTPIVLLVPVVFTQFFQASEDYYNRSDFGAMRALRVVAFLLSLLAPSFYIAVTTFHQEMLPTSLLINLATQREGVPFPAFIEAMFMEFTFEILREAGIRMPRMIGPAISIVGALVIGEAAVQAGLVTPAMIIVVSITAISNFVFPAIAMSIPIRFLRFGLMGAAAAYGIYGIFIGLVAIYLHLCSLRSFGVPYMSPMAPFNLSDQKDTLFRFPLWAMRTRPRLISQKNKVREQTQNPEPGENRP